MERDNWKTNRWTVERDDETVPGRYVDFGNDDGFYVDGIDGGLDERIAEFIVREHNTLRRITRDEPAVGEPGDKTNSICGALYVRKHKTQNRIIATYYYNDKKWVKIESYDRDKGRLLWLEIMAIR